MYISKEIFINLKTKFTNNEEIFCYIFNNYTFKWAGCQRKVGATDMWTITAIIHDEIR